MSGNQNKNLAESDYNGVVCGDFKLLKKHVYPSRTIDDAYDDIMKQVDNYKQYADI